MTTVDDEVDQHPLSDTETEVEEEEPLLPESKESAPLSRETSPEPAPGRSERLDPPSPSAWKRVALLAFIAALFCYGLHLRGQLLDAKRKSKVIYASRYSKEFKYRPAASPIITETLKDGRVRVRGAPPTPTPTPTPVAKKRKSTSGKRKARKKSPKKRN